MLPTKIPFLSLGLFILFLRSQATAELLCSHRFLSLPLPQISDCRYILKQLPTLRLRPDELAGQGSLTLTLGPLRRNPLHLPAKIFHNTCWVSAHAYVPGNTYAAAAINSQSESFHLWTEVRERALAGIEDCLGHGFSFASYIQDVTFPNMGTLGLAVTVGNLPSSWEYTFNAGETRFYNV